jgi:hypothetical protein
MRKMPRSTPAAVPVLLAVSVMRPAFEGRFVATRPHSTPSGGRMNLICRRRVLARTESETTVHQWFH